MIFIVDRAERWVELYCDDAWCASEAERCVDVGVVGVGVGVGVVVCVKG